MIAQYYKQSRKRDFYCSGTDCIRRKKYTYASCLEYLNNNGITVKMPLQAAASGQSYSGGKSLSEEGLVENGLLRYRKSWEKSEADIFVNGDVITGVPILADENILRIDNATHSYCVPMEKIECIRLTDELRRTRQE